MAGVKRDTGDIIIGTPAPAWMLSFADMMTQILVFFILLFSLSDINLLKLSTYFKKMKKPPVVLDEDQLRRVMVEIGEWAQKRGLADVIAMEINERGLAISFSEKLMFNSGSADILTQSLPLLNEIVSKLKNVNNEVNIEGHTDNIPIANEKFGSNWELSTARSTNVVKYLVEQMGVSPTRISASGYAEYRPVTSNDTSAGRSANRRVVLIVLRQRVTLIQ